MMNKIVKKIAAALCSGIMLISAVPFSVSAENDFFQLPSGNALYVVSSDLSGMTNNISDVPTHGSAAVGIFNGDEVLYTGYFGKTDIENEILCDEDTVFEWGSISKTFIWVSTMQLWEQGRLDLEHDVREYLPEGFFQHLSYDEPITMLNLMNHNAGWQETVNKLFVYDGEEIPPLKEALQQIEPEQVNRPNEVTAYSNYGAAVAGYVIECISGMPYSEYIRRNIIEPLKMEHTAVAPDLSDNAWVQEQRKKEKCYKFGINSYTDMGTMLYHCPIYPAGSITGTMTDLMTYAQALVNKDAPLFQSPSTQEELFKGTDFYGDSDLPICAHGFFCMEYAVRTYGHTGRTPMTASQMLFDLESGIGVVTMINQDSSSYMAMSIDSEAVNHVFGEMPVDKYAAGNEERANIKGYYLPARSYFRGMLNVYPYLEAVKADSIGEIRNVGKGVYRIVSEGTVRYGNLGDTAMLIGEKNINGGRKAIQQVSSDLIYEKYYAPKLFLFALYLLTAAAAVFLAVIERTLRKHGKLEKYSASPAIWAGRTASAVSVIAFLYLIAVFDYGISVSVQNTASVLQKLCLIVSGISAVCSAAALVREKKHTSIYLLNTVCCVIMISAVVYFGMYRA